MNGEAVRLDGWWHYPDGTRLRVVSGGADDGDGGSGAGSGDGSGSGSGDSGAGSGSGASSESGSGAGAGSGSGERQFTQAEVDRMVGDRATSIRNAERERVAALLGVDPDEAAKIVAAHREREQAQLTEAERAAQAAQADREAAAAERAQARNVLRDTYVEAALVAAGIPAEHAERGRGLVSLTVEDGMTPDDLKARATEAVAAVKAEWPELFAAANGAGKPPSGDSGKPPSGGQAGADALAAGAARAAKFQGREPAQT